MLLTLTLKPLGILLQDYVFKMEASMNFISVNFPCICFPGPILER